jgi:hypothetical protein
MGLAQRLRDRGVSVEEWSFNAQSVGRLGQTLHLLLRDHRLALPDDEDLLNELMTVRLRESAPGVYRLDHDAGEHDDRAVSLGLAALALIEKVGSNYGAVSNPNEVAAQMNRLPGQRPANPYAARRLRGVGADIHAAQRAQTPLQRAHGIGLAVRGSAIDPGR